MEGLEIYGRVVARLYESAAGERGEGRVIVYLASLLEPMAFAFASALHARRMGPDPQEMIHRALSRTPATPPVQLGVLRIDRAAEILAETLPQVPTALAELRALAEARAAVPRGEQRALALVNRRVELIQLRDGSDRLRS